MLGRINKARFLNPDQPHAGLKLSGGASLTASLLIAEALQVLESGADTLEHFIPGPSAPASINVAQNVY